ncbi:hypothetical protein [Parasphingorhabdus halotolerans]|uniref:Uncharacterized protein n=1 Tax=Parasphingorhabdus halotolerans TaxID=2725558 RepID=A0A6H2DLR2_9SPHN|nr:hypothetical protein [Parasphingorhabdus halotolerans]QJB68923.1 hypothetical protein HF685_06240 [Parasphingorhabdus halotolerans]
MEIIDFSNPLCAGIYFAAKAPSTSFRFLGFVSLFILSLICFHLLVDLPHRNTKFYYIFGTVFSILLAISDYLHRLEINPVIFQAKERTRLEILGKIYEKWTSIFQFSLGVLVAVVGTVSFTVLSYIRIVFGESFSFYPLLGIVVSIVFIGVLFYWGILRNIVLIQKELEEQMAK